MAKLTVRYQGRGVHLPELGLWLDSPVRQMGAETAFISHGHADHVANHREVILSPFTAQVVRRRLGGKPIQHILPFHQPAPFRTAGIPYQLTLLPSGHILGSAMAWIESGQGTLLYTGDFKLQPGLAVEPCQPQPAEILIMETTFGRPRYQFPPAQEVLAAAADFCREALAQRGTALLLAYSLGKSQALLQGLRAAGLPLMLHREVLKWTRLYEQFGQSFPPFEELDPAAARGKVLIWPPHAARPSGLWQLGPVRTAIFTGWALEASCRYRFGTDAAFPLSDHADFPDLIQLVKHVSPVKVFTLHGFAADFAQTLRELGYDAQALSEADQLSFPGIFPKA